ncbi:MAG: putative baseplate assembly protein, partial [Actinomycetota bacterium]|nr:putative baseplate assembly protein [Actinomycetota bacterium]
MTFPEVVLDDRRFQELVTEARLRIARTCPEWTEHNVSDPGITLIELFAWMTDMLIYRLNRIPEKLHVALLELLGIQLEPPACAASDLRFRLAAPAEQAVEILAGETEVGTVRTAQDESIVFQTNEDFTIPSARPAAYVVQRGGRLKDV